MKETSKIAMYISRGLLFFIFYFLFSPVGAQDDTRLRDIYTQAEDDYQIGRIEQARDVLVKNLNSFQVPLETAPECTTTHCPQLSGPVRHTTDGALRGRNTGAESVLQSLVQRPEHLYRHREQHEGWQDGYHYHRLQPGRESG